MHFTVEKKNAKKLIKQNKSNFRKTSKELVQQMVEKKTKKQKTRVTTTVNKSVLLRRYQQYRREKIEFAKPAGRFLIHGFVPNFHLNLSLSYSRLDQTGDMNSQGTPFFFIYLFVFSLSNVYIYDDNLSL